MTDERRLVLFLAGAIVRDPHHGESPTRREQDLNLPRTCGVQALLNEVVHAVVITTTPRIDHLLFDHMFFDHLAVCITVILSLIL